MSIYGIYVDQKNIALANVEDAESKALQFEDSEIVKNLATLPANHPQVAIHTARRTAIRTALVNKGK